MKNLGQMLKQAQALQSKMVEMQEQLAREEVTGASGGGMVQVTMSGKGDVRKIKIDPALANADEIEILEDLIVAAVNDARGKAEARMAESMGQLTGGIPLPPGFKLPF